MTGPMNRTDFTDLFEDGATGSRTQIRASRCEKCTRLEFPARTLCPACGAPSAPVRLGEDAVARTVTAVLAPAPGSKREAPYDVCVAQFAEGICVIGLADGPVRVGEAVYPTVIDAFPGQHTFGFRSTTAR